MGRALGLVLGFATSLQLSSRAAGRGDSLVAPPAPLRADLAHEAEDLLFRDAFVTGNS